MNTAKLRQLLKVILIMSFMWLSGCDLFTNPEARISNAQQYQADSNHQAAIIELKKVLGSDPKHAQARLLLAKSYAWFGQWANAEKELRRAADLGVAPEQYQVQLGEALLAQNRFQPLLDELPVKDNASAELLSLRGEAYIALNQSDEALKIYNKLLQNEDAKLLALIGLSKTNLADGNIDQAKDYIAKALEIDSNSIDALMVNGQIQFVSADFAQAEQQFSKMLILGENKLPRFEQFTVLGGLVESQIQQGKKDEARENINALTKQFPSHPRSKYFVSMVAYDDKDYEKARDNLQSVLSVLPDFLPAQILMGAVNFQLGNYEQADTILTSVLSSNPHNKEIRKLLVATRLRHGQVDEAMSILDPKLEAVSQDSDLLMMAGRAKIQSGDKEAGIALLEHATTQFPKDSRLQMDLASAYLSQGQLDRAISSLNAVVAEDQEKLKRDALLVFAHVQNKESGKAIALLNTQLKENPKNATAHTLLGAVYSMGESKDPAKAYDHFNAALSLEPKNISALMGLGRLAVNDKNLDEANKRFYQVHTINPKHLNAVLALAQLAEQSKQPEDVLKWLIKAVDINPAAKTKGMMFRYLFKGGKYKQLESQAKRLMTDDPKDTVSVNALVLALIKQNKLDEALTVINDASVLQPQEPSFYYSQARVYLEKKENKLARRAYRKVLELNSMHQAAIVGLVELEEKAGNLSEAIKLIDHYQQQAPNSIFSYVLRGNVLLRQKQAEKAVSAFAYALTLEPNNFQVLSKLYQSKRAANDHGIEGDLKTWLTQHPGDNRVKFLLAEHYQLLKKNEDAISMYEELVKHDSNNFVALNNLAWLYHLKSDQRALETAESAYSLKSDDPSIEDTLGWIMINTGKVDKGVKLLQSAVGKAPNVPDLQYHLAVGLYRQGNKDQARPILKDLLESNVKFSYTDEAKTLYQSL